MWSWCLPSATCPVGKLAMQRSPALAQLCSIKKVLPGDLVGAGQQEG
jgi:hypothetical protein